MARDEINGRSKGELGGVRIINENMAWHDRRSIAFIIANYKS